MIPLNETTVLVINQPREEKDAEKFLELVLGQYLGAKYRDAARSEVKRLVRSAVLTVQQKEKGQ